MNQLENIDFMPQSENNNTLMVELSGEETYWNINTAGVFRTSYGAKNKVVYNRHATEKQSAETVEASLSGELNGTTHRPACILLYNK